MMRKQTNFLSAVDRLAEGTAEYAANPTTLRRDGLIQRVEFTFELAWKSMKEYLEDQGVSTLQFPKQVLAEAYAAGMLRDDQVWLRMLSSRNVTSHIYSDSQAAAIAGDITDRFLPALRELAAYYTAQ